MRTLSGNRSAAILLAFGLSTALAPGAGADLVVLVDDRVLKVTTYLVVGETAQMELPSGGRLTLPIGRIERVVDDEIVPEEEILEPSPVFTIAFDDADAVPETPYGELIYEAAKRHSLNPSLVAAVVRAESAFDASAVSHKGARGLMQLMPATADRLGIEPGDLFDPGPNLEAGTRYLEWLRGRFGDDLPLMLAAYNAGEGNVDRYGGVPPFRETRDYLRRIYRQLGLPEAPATE